MAKQKNNGGAPGDEGPTAAGGIPTAAGDNQKPDASAVPPEPPTPVATGGGEGSETASSADPKAGPTDKPLPLFHVQEKNHPAANIYAADEDEARKLYADKVGLNLKYPGDHPILSSRIQGYLSVETIDILLQAKANMAARLQEVTLDKKPSYTDQGRTMSWTEYMNSLITGLKDLDDAIARAGVPVEIVSRGVT